MQSPLRSQGSGWVGVAGAAGLLVSVLILSGCPGTLDPNQFNMTSGTGGSGTGGSGTGGSNPTGGSTGTGGGSGSCTGGNCATTFCHIPGAKNADTCGGLDLTVDANIGSRLVGVRSVGTVDNGSECMANTTPYLNAGSNPATGLLIDKITMSPPSCGSLMPDSAPFPLNATQRSCLIQWATTLTSP
jgi:hypothetical protein